MRLLMSLLVGVVLSGCGLWKQSVPAPTKEQIRLHGIVDFDKATIRPDSHAGIAQMFPYDLAMLVAIVLSVILLGFGAVILGMILTGQIDLSDILVESGENGSRKASLSRLQFLMFSFVIAGLYLVICVESGTFVDVPPGVLILLGISGGSYVVSKGMGNGKLKQPGTGQQQMRQPHPQHQPQPQPVPMAAQNGGSNGAALQ